MVVLHFFKKKGRKERNRGRRWLYCRWKKSVRWPPVMGCSGDGHGCVTLFVIVCFVCAAMMIVMLKYKQEASGRVCFLKTRMGMAHFTSFIKKKKIDITWVVLTQPNLVLPGLIKGSLY